jgi:hypothetical protein
LQKIGRNDPCPCGSGKKYKHCCLQSSTLAINNTNRDIFHDEDQLFDGLEVQTTNEDYHKILEQIDSNRLKEFSAPRLLYSIILHPEVEGLANDVYTEPRI